MTGSPFLFAFLILGLATANAAAPNTGARKRLLLLWNDVDLTIRNHRSNLADLDRQVAELNGLQVYERIPIGASTAEKEEHDLRKILRPAADRAGIHLRQIQVTADRAAPPVPSFVLIDGDPAKKPFRLSPSQVVQTFRIIVQVEGERSQVQDWISNWNAPAVVSRLLVPTSKLRGKNRSWKIEAEAFRFRDVQFPALKIQIPEPTQEDPSARLVKEIRILAPKATPLLEVRRKFLLNDARLSFFIQLQPRLKRVD